MRKSGALARASHVVFVALLGTVLASCTDADRKAMVTGRWGPSPALQPAEVDSVIHDQTQVLQYIELEAGLIKPDGAGSYAQTGSLTTAQLWYTVAQWGFNVGRQDCEIYLNTLYRLSREKQRNDSALAALAAGTAAILTPTHASAKSLSIVAAAFGLTTALNDAFFQTYLFTEAPGLISIKVKDLQDAYQKSLGSSSITTSDQAYSAVQHYYTICLPESIEGVLLEAVATSSAKVKTTSSGNQNAQSSAGNILASPKLVQTNPAK
jgi:hypothetical protein